MAGSKTWGNNTPYRRRVWQCNEKYRTKGKVNCNTPFVTDEELQKAFVLAFNRIVQDKDGYIDSYAPIVAALTGTGKYDADITTLQERCTGIYAEIEQLIKDNAHHAQAQSAYREQYEALAGKYETLKAQLADIEAAKLRQVLRREKITRFLEDLRGRDGLMEEFDEPVFRALTERMTVYSKKDISVTFRDGHEVHVDVSG